MYTFILGFFYSLSREEEHQQTGSGTVGIQDTEGSQEGADAALVLSTDVARGCLEATSSLFLENLQ
jgi:hypothetical protein